MSKQASLSQIVAILDHDRVQQDWIVKAIVNDKGEPTVETIARIAWIFPRDGAGRLRVAVTDWGKRNERHEPAQYVSEAHDWGYDKRTAALDGCTVGGVELGNHYSGRPQLDDVCREHGWHRFSGGR